MKVFSTCTVQCGGIEAKALGIFRSIPYYHVLVKKNKLPRVGTSRDIRKYPTKFQQKIIQLWQNPTPKPTCRERNPARSHCLTNSRVWDPGIAFFFLNPRKNSNRWPELEDWVAAWQALGIPGDRQGEAWSASANFYARRGFSTCSIARTRLVATQIFFIFTPKFGEDEPNLTCICFTWVGSTT